MSWCTFIFRRVGTSRLLSEGHYPRINYERRLTGHTRDGRALRTRSIRMQTREGFFKADSRPVIVTIRDNKDTMKLLYSSYTTITGWGVFLRGFQRIGSPFWGAAHARKPS